jgi:hypothetical protein
MATGFVFLFFLFQEFSVGTTNNIPWGSPGDRIDDAETQNHRLIDPTRIFLKGQSVT